MAKCGFGLWVGVAALAACGDVEQPDGGAGTEPSATSSGPGSGPTPSAGPSDSGSGSMPPETTADPPATSSETSAGDESGSEDETGDPPIPAECEGSPLADIAQDLAPGTWATMPANASLVGLDIERAMFSWADSAVFDAATRQVHFVAAPGSCCSDNPLYQRLTYDEPSNEWSMVATPFVGAGHMYDGNALEPGTTNHYFAKYSDPEVRLFDGTDWSALPEIPFYAPATMGLTWFPEMNGLVYVGGNGNLGFFDGAAWSVIEGAEQWGTYNVFAEYSTAHQIVWMGGGNGAGELNYTLAGDGTLTRQPDAPIHLGTGTSLNMHDPVSGNFIAYNFDVDAWWELDPIAEEWSALEMLEAPTMHHYKFQVPLPHCGVILFVDQYYEDRNMYLYRHG